MHKSLPLSVLVVASLLSTAAATGEPPAAQPPAPAVGDPSRTVTLITGDKVTLVDDDQIAVHRGAGREDMTFIIQRDDDHHYVLPADAAPLVAAGRLDIRLFDVPLLHSHGYHDGRGDLPLIVTNQPATLATLRAAEGIEVTHALPVVDGAAILVEKAATDRFWADLRAAVPVAGDPARTAAAGPTVWLDGVLEPVLEQSVPQVGAPHAWALDLDGTGATVAVVDTGIDATHPDLAGRVVGQRNFTEGAADDPDTTGHGTHVASVVAGTGAASDGRYRGVAPGANLLDAKACTGFRCQESWVVAAMQWAAEQGADVINVSMSEVDTTGLDPVEQAVQTLTEQYGALFVVAAGNGGPVGRTVRSPGSAEAALTVGAVDPADRVLFFSSRGPRIDGALKPDMTAPGGNIVAAKSSHVPPAELYATGFGTSVAAGHVSGAAAILLQQHPDWTPERIKAALMGSAAPHPDFGVYDQGTGRLDVARAVDQPVTAIPPSITFDPESETDGTPQSRTITYHNDGATDVTLDLTVTAARGQVPAGDGVFSLNRSTVTVPAGGAADVVLTADGPASELAGLFIGHVTATGPGVRIALPFAAELRLFDVTLEHLDDAGSPTSFFTILKAGDSSQQLSGVGTARVSVAAGDLQLASVVADVGGDPFRPLNRLLAAPRIMVDRNLTIQVDARHAQEISVAPPEPGAGPVRSAVSVNIDRGGSIGVDGTTFDGIRAGRIGPATTADGMVSNVTSIWARPHPDGGFLDSPYTYNLTWFEPGRMIHGFQRSVTRHELATVHVTTSEQVPGSIGLTASRPSRGRVIGGGNSVTLVPFTLPSRRVDYYNGGPDVTWEQAFVDGAPGPDPTEPDLSQPYTTAFSEPTLYEPGRHYHERWNHGVFAPVLPSPVQLDREGDWLSINPTTHGDGDGRQQFGPESGTVTVFRDGELIAELPELHWTPVEVPPEPAEYRVEVEAQRPEPFVFSTRTSITWTFRSAHAPDEQRLPVSVIRFPVRLDRDNSAPAGQPYLVPVQVVPNPGSTAGTTSRPRVEVSFDDGATWRRVPVLAGVAIVLHPDGDGFVSLRAGATDGDGNSVEQTIIRAYRID